jgi:cation diffusion facilitator CzcD-associated flavoprotein CzcO
MNVAEHQKTDSSWVQAGLAEPRIIIVGSGLSGLCLAIRLKQAGIDSFTILEESDAVGGTWLKNTYPNAGCDIPSYLYSYSFAPKYDWTRKYARQPEILAYIQECAERFGIADHIEFGTSVASARFEQDRSIWHIHTGAGDIRTADFFVSAVGQLNRPNIPQIDGLDGFEGPMFHSAKWDHDCNLAGQRVAVIGTGASATQFLPGVAEQAEHVLLFQRTPVWVQPFRDYDYPRWASRLFRWVPGAARLYRMWLFVTLDLRFRAFGSSSTLNRLYRQYLMKHMRSLASGKLLRAIRPNYAPGCKRIVYSTDYIQTLSRTDVDLITAPIARMGKNTIVTDDGEHPIDAVIFATGFETGHFLSPIEVAGRDGQRLDDGGQRRLRTWFGVMASDFPNMFMLYGPNTNLGHNSILFMIEQQADLILRIVKRAKKTGTDLVEVPEKLVETFDVDLQNALESTVWAGSCGSWYKNADGNIVTNWGSSAFAYGRQTKSTKLDALSFGRCAEHATVAATDPAKITTGE